MLGKALTDSTLGQLTAAGAGAAVGNYAQRQMSSTKSWVIDLRFNDGRTMEIKSSDQPLIKPGDIVRVQNGSIVWAGSSQRR